MRKSLLSLVLCSIFFSSLCQAGEGPSVTEQPVSTLAQGIWDYVYNKHPIWSAGAIVMAAGMLLYVTNKNVRDGIQTMLGLKSRRRCYHVRVAPVVHF